MKKTIVFDMDGTLADLYNVENWLEKLRKYDPSPYENAGPKIDMELLNKMLLILKSFGWRVAVTSWLSKESTEEYDKKVIAAKYRWLRKYDFFADEIHIVKYGMSKGDCTRHIGGYQVLVDDNKEIREQWSLGDTIDASTDFLGDIFKLIEREGF